MTLAPAPGLAPALVPSVFCSVWAARAHKVQKLLARGPGLLCFLAEAAWGGRGPGAGRRAASMIRDSALACGERGGVRVAGELREAVGVW